MIDKKKMQVKISNRKETILYFKPLHQNDILENIQYSAKLDITFIDNNTIMMRTNARVGELFNLNVSGRKITLLVEP